MPRIIDLTLPLEPGLRGFASSPRFTLADDGWNGTTLEIYSHCGTHMDAPRHFLPGRAGIEAQDLGAVMGPAQVIDLTPVEPGALIAVGDLGPAADTVGPGDRLLLRTDWTRNHGGTPLWRDGLPRVSDGLAAWLVEKKVALLGVEPPSVADVNNLEEVTRIHHTLLGGGVVIVEGLTNLDQITRPVVDFTALPLNIPGCDGSPVRAVAVER